MGKNHTMRSLKIYIVHECDTQDGVRNFCNICMRLRPGNLKGLVGI